LEEILRVCNSKPDLITKILERTYDNSSGNLHNLQILFSDNEIQQKFEDRKVPFGLILRDTILSLTAQESMLLSSVVAHGGRVDRELLGSLFKEIKLLRVHEFLFSNTVDLISSLEKKQLIRITRNHIETAQDSVIDEAIQLPQLQKYLLINYRNWLSFYHRLKESEHLIPVSEIIAMEIFFMAMLEDYSGIGDLLEELYKLALKSIAPKRAISYLELILENLEKKKHVQSRNLRKRIVTSIVRILYRFWHFEDILKYAEEFVDDAVIFAFYGTSLALTGSQNKAIEICDEALKVGKNQEVALLIRIIAYRSSNRYEECEQEWRYHFQKETFNDTPLYQMFLRCADLAILSDPLERFNILSEVVSSYQNDSNPLEEISARNAMASQFGYSGMLDEALAEFGKAKIIADNILSQHYALENNLSVLDIQRGENSELTLRRLESASAICETKLDQFIIWINLQVICSLLGMVSEVEAVIRSIEQRIFNKEIVDFDLIRIAYFNIYVFYEASGNKDLSEYFREKAVELPLLVDHEFWSSKLSGVSIENLNDDFRLDLGYYPVYINYWHFDFDSVLGNWTKSSQ
jgi:tetratricopeptide (TPR) repeat protein